jgi:GntR family transcriptional regulator
MLMDNKKLIPMYYQIFEKIYTEIREGLYQDGDLIPSESELCKKYEVSRGTVREALKLLLQEGFLVRKQGKGTFVSHSKIEQDFQKLMGFTELMRMHNKKAKAKILEMTVKNPSKRIQKLLKIPESQKIVKIQRLRFGDNEPLIIERSYFIHELFKPLLECDLENHSIYELLSSETKVRLGTATQSIEAVVAGPAECELFSVNHGSPLLLIKRSIETEDGAMFEYSEDMYRSDKLKFFINTDPYHGRDQDPYISPLSLIENHSEKYL